MSFCTWPCSIGSFYQSLVQQSIPIQKHKYFRWNICMSINERRGLYETPKVPFPKHSKSSKFFRSVPTFLAPRGVSSLPLPLFPFKHAPWPSLSPRQVSHAQEKQLATNFIITLLRRYGELVQSYVYIASSCLNEK